MKTTKSKVTKKENLPPPPPPRTFDRVGIKARAEGKRSLTGNVSNVFDRKFQGDVEKPSLGQKTKAKKPTKSR